MNIRKKITALVAGGALIAMLAGCTSGSGGGSASASSTSSGSPIKVGIIVSVTGNYSTQAKDFQNGFNAAVDYLSGGTNKIAGHPIQITVGDDTGDPAVGTSLAKQMVGEGVQVLTGPTDSSVAQAVADVARQNNVLYLGGSSGTSAFVGLSPLVFGTVGASPAGSPLTAKELGDDAKGKSIAFIGQDYAYGQSTLAQEQAAMKPLGVTVVPYLLPQTTTDFLPLTVQMKQHPTDFVTSTWAGNGTTQLYSALGSQGILDSSTFLSPLLLTNTFAPIAQAFGKGISNVTFSISYFAGMTNNAADTALQKYSKAHNHTVEYDDAIGWVAAALLNAGIKGGGADPTAMASAIQKAGSVQGPAGDVLIRAEDNQITAPAALGHLVQQADGSWAFKMSQLYPASELVPAMVKPLPK